MLGGGLGPEEEAVERVKECGRFVEMLGGGWLGLLGK